VRDSLSVRLPERFEEFGTDLQLPFHPAGLAYFGAFLERAQAGTEAEALDTDLERAAAAMEQILEEGFQAEGTLDVVLNFGDFAMSEFFPAGADGSIVAEAAKKKLDFGEREAHIASEPDQQGVADGIARIAALAAAALKRGQEAEFFIVADGGGV
jgi:hypothetical protein